MILIFLIFSKFTNAVDPCYYSECYQDLSSEIEKVPFISNCPTEDIKTIGEIEMLDTTPVEPNVAEPLHS